jgi:protein TonB
VLLKVLVKADGSVIGVSVEEGIPGYPELDEAAVESVMKWKFKPATADGEPVDMTIMVPVEFRLDKSKSKK